MLPAERLTSDGSAGGRGSRRHEKIGMVFRHDDRLRSTAKGFVVATAGVTMW